MRALSGRWMGVDRSRTTLLAATVVGLLSFVPATSPAQVDTSRAPRDTACVAVSDSARENKNLIERLRRCARIVDSTRRYEALRIIHPSIQRLAEIPWFIPEYHDEQRLSDGMGGLGPMAHIYASPYLSTYTTTDQISENGPVGILVALVAVDLLPGETLPGTYQALNLRDGMNCLYLAYTPGTAPAAQWKARVGHPAVGQPCDRTTDGPTLSVIPSKITGFGAADVPGVARFSEATGGAPLLGIKCLDAWCEIGPPGFASQVPANTSTGREGRIKGWHDEQLLTDRVGGVLKPINVRASVIPVKNLASFTAASFEAGWKTVATIEIKGPADPPVTSKYFKWGLRHGRNRLQIRKTASGWEAQLLPPGSTAARSWVIIDREPHFDAAVPGTARWRWTVLDDGVWVPCGQACCQAEGSIM